MIKCTVYFTKICYHAFNTRDATGDEHATLYQWDTVYYIGLRVRFVLTIFGTV